MADRITRVVSGPQIEAGDGGFYLHIANPLDKSYLGLPPAGTTLKGEQGSDVLLSVNHEGEPQARATHQKGQDERCTKQGMFLVFKADGPQRFLIPFAE